MSKIRNIAALPGARSAATILAVATVYTVFLLFAQFAFLHAIQDAGHASGTVHTVLGAMAGAGIGAGFFAAGCMHRVGAPRMLAAGLAITATAATLAGILFFHGLATAPALLIISALTGTGIGIATVALACAIRGAVGGPSMALHVGCGTALAYLVCNIPAVFTASPLHQCWITAGVAVFGTFTTMLTDRSSAPTHSRSDQHFPADLPLPSFSRAGIAAITAGFFALVWFDSTAFAVVQQTPSLQARLWGSASTLWANGAAHAVAAVLAGWLLDRGWFRVVLGASMLALLIGTLGFSSEGSFAAVAAPLYAAGVSFYSVAFACYAALGRSRPSLPGRAWRAAWLYAVAGWIGSGLGVGLAGAHGVIPSWAAPAALIWLAAAMVALLFVQRRGVAPTP